MANKLVEELIIKVKQTGAKTTETTLKKVVNHLEDAAVGVELLNSEFDKLPRMLQKVEVRTAGLAKQAHKMNAAFSSSAITNSLDSIDTGITSLISSIIELNEDTNQNAKAMVSHFDALANSIGHDLDRVQDSLIDVAGSSDKTTKAVKQTGKAFEGLGKDADKAGRGLGNSHRQGRNQARTFASIARVAGPLPLLYAQIAGNAFALSEAFRLISEGEQINRLEEVGTTLGASVGVPVQTIARDMQKLTGYTLSYSESLRQAAAVSSYGFDQEQITMLTSAARRASIALGVDMTDALNRVVRGSSKLEIELLDELGITTKLTTAYEKYAQQIGVSATALNSYQQRAALINEINSQSVDKFGQLNSMLEDGLPWEKFGANSKTAMDKLLQRMSAATEGAANLMNSLFEESDQLAAPMQKVADVGETFMKALTGGQVGGQYGAAVAMEQLKVQLVEQKVELQKIVDLYKSGMGDNEQAQIAYNTIQNINGALTTLGSRLTFARAALSNQDVETVNDAFRAMNSAVKGSAQEYKKLESGLKGQSKSYIRLYGNIHDMAEAYRGLRAATTDANMLKAVKDLGFETESQLFRAEALAKSYMDVNTALGKFVATSAQMKAVGGLNGTDPEETRIAILTKELAIRNKLFRTSQALGVDATQLATLEASALSTAEKLSATQIALLNRVSGRRDVQIELNDLTGTTGELGTMQASLANEKLRLSALQNIVGSTLEQEASLNRIHTIQAQITNLENQRARTSADSYLNGISSGIGMNSEDKAQTQMAERAATYSSALGDLTGQVDGLGAMANAFTDLTLAASGFGSTASSALQLTSVGLQGFAGMLQMTSQQAIGSIDAQIQMERKRDGKSRESLEKIKQLEAKKIREQQKAAQKQILISTAVAVMNAAANPWPMPAIPLMAAAALAGTMAYSQASSAASNQMAGLGSGGTSNSASLSMGDRSNQVDVSGAATQGELSYIRGDQGVGSISSYTPRAAGGLMTPGLSFVAGENGPEVITPVSPMQANKSEDSTSNGTGESAKTPLVFSPNIQAMDAQSVIDRSEDIFEAFVISAEQRGIDIYNLR